MGGGESMNKNYNPFKMWGSYVGAVVLFLSWKIVQTYDGTGLRAILFWTAAPFFKLSNIIIRKVLPIGFIPTSQMTIDVISWGTFLISGFLIGWVIHSLFRRYLG